MKHPAWGVCATEQSSAKMDVALAQCRQAKMMYRDLEDALGEKICRPAVERGGGQLLCRPV